MKADGITKRSFLRIYYVYYKQALSLIIKTACVQFKIEDKSHIAYIFASAHHESNMGRSMTEPSDDIKYEG